MNKLIELFTNGHGSFSRDLQFEVVVMVLIVIFTLVKFFDKTYGFVIILIIFCMYLGENYVNLRTSKITDFNSITLTKLDSIQATTNSIVNDRIAQLNNSRQKLSKKDIHNLYSMNKLDSLYINANMIHFIHGIIPLAQYNTVEFLLFVKGVNNILRLKKEIEEYHGESKEYPENIAEMFQTSLQLKTKTINNLHNFIYSLPKITKMYTYLGDVTQQYSELISKDIDIIHTYYKSNISERGINSTTHFVSYNETKPFDTTLNHSIIPNKSNSKLIDFH